MLETINIEHHLRFKNGKDKFSWQKKWSGHGRTGRTADYGLGIARQLLAVTSSGVIVQQFLIVSLHDS